MFVCAVCFPWCFGFVFTEFYASCRMPGDEIEKRQASASSCRKGTARAVGCQDRKLLLQNDELVSLLNQELVKIFNLVCLQSGMRRGSSDSPWNGLRSGRR